MCAHTVSYFACGKSELNFEGSFLFKKRLVVEWSIHACVSPAWDEYVSRLKFPSCYCIIPQEDNLSQKVVIDVVVVAEYTPSQFFCVHFQL